MKAKLVRGVSIGFRPIEYSFMDTGGIRFSQTEVFELSLVTVPANAAATIQPIKSLDTKRRSPFGRERRAFLRRLTPGTSGIPPLRLRRILKIFTNRRRKRLHPSNYSYIRLPFLLSKKK